MSASKQTAFRLSPTALQYLAEFGEKHNLNRTESLEQIIREHKSNSDKETDILAEKLLERIDEKYKNLFTHLRLSTNFTDKNVQIMTEVINSMLIHFNIKNAYTTDIAKSPVLSEAESSVKNRISHFKQQKDNKTQN